MNKGANVKLKVGSVSKTGKKVLAWNYEEPRHKKYTMQCTKCGYTCQTSIKSFYNTCKSCSTVRTVTTTKERQLWLRYRSKAKKEKQQFSITEEQFSKIVKENCLYCGKQPSQKLVLGRKSDNILLYNGVDRKNDIDGYTVENCAPCCWICNQAKKNYGIDEFKNMVNAWSKRLDLW